MAYATQRTLILQSEGWRYSSKGWESVFLPLSKTCRSPAVRTPQDGDLTNSMTDDSQVIELPILDMLSPRPRFLPLALPEDLADRLTRVHCDPAAWWVGQCVTYLTRPNEMLQELLDESKQNLGFTNPVVGVHVRRTDNVIKEALVHSVDDYMRHVDEWFDIYEKQHSGVQRKVYLASDDPGVLPEAKKKALCPFFVRRVAAALAPSIPFISTIRGCLLCSPMRWLVLIGFLLNFPLCWVSITFSTSSSATYPHFIFVSDYEVSKTASLGSCYTDASLCGVILDTYLLSRCDYLVCTFSSQVCRVAYELMQPLHGDASERFKSLDDIYYFGGKNAHNWLAVENHQSRREGDISFNAGDTVGVAGNYWDGYSNGKNTKTGKSGLFPSYKTVNKIDLVKMPTYP
ncbi:alpha-(1,6)-fucosyltransferase-like isoform X2 [Dreissena polymorpha]|nr:alpha-(1,6)-fucosyltransferase-like isoform X2 [Dreissena polymorpha]